MVKKIIFLTLVAVLASACSALGTGQNPAPNVDTQATIDAIVRQSEAQTQAAQPSPTTVPPTDTSTPVVASSPTATAESTSEAPTSTPIPNLTTTPATATPGTDVPTFTATATQPVSGGPTLTPTLGILTYGTLPPAVPFASIKVFNKSKAQAYISLQNDAVGRPDSVLEYPVEKEVRVKAPLGYYLYVVWVGGRQIVGEFILNENDDLTITIYKDKVVVQ